MSLLQTALKFNKRFLTKKNNAVLLKNETNL